jgi:LacI family gluconate utilization system Gnt-I transcriptional repressor
MNDVAKLAGVSAMTVSRALKGGGSVTEKTRKRILQAVEELGYVLDMSAGALSSKRTDFVSVLIPSVNNSIFSEYVHGISEVLEREGKQTLLGYTDYSQEREEQLIETMLRRRPEGIIVTGSQHTPRARHLLLQAGIPVIETWDLPEAPIDHVVGFSNAATIEDLMARLLFRGYRRIAFIGGDESADARGIERRRGYERAVKTLGLERSHVVSMGTPPITIEHGGLALVRLMEEWPEVEAVICVSDLSAFGIIMECHRRNWPVPGRLAVAGFGDFQIARHCWPSLTTISVNCREIGLQAGELMLRAFAGIQSGKPLSSQTIKIPHSIIEREST